LGRTEDVDLHRERSAQRIEAGILAVLALLELALARQDDVAVESIASMKALEITSCSFASGMSFM
jgi:hypothetical protein